MYLNEQLIISKSQESNLAAIKTLNLWNCELTNVSALKKLPNLEILGLGVNRINSLRGLRGCVYLEELDLRGNDIRDLNELSYLQNASLKYLDLTENPCCRCEDYRSNVLKILPSLRVLDKIEVTDDELEFALTLNNLEFNLDERSAVNRNQHSGGEMTPQNQSPARNLELELNYPNTPLQRSMNMAYGAEQCPRDTIGIPTRQDFTEQQSQHFGQQQWTRKPAKKLAKGREQWVAELQQQNQQVIQLSPTSKQHHQQTQQPQQLRSHLNPKVSPPHPPRHSDYGQHNRSLVDVNEWLHMQGMPHKTVNRRSKRGSVSERGFRTICDNRQLFRGNQTPRPPHQHYFMSSRGVPSITMDSVSNVSSPTSSVLSSSQDRCWVPRSRRVNLLCASLRFILELDALTLVDVLSTIHERIEELCTK